MEEKGRPQGRRVEGRAKGKGMDVGVKQITVVLRATTLDKEIPNFQKQQCQWDHIIGLDPHVS